MFSITVTPCQVAKAPAEGSFLQTPFWAEFKAMHGWKNARFTIDIAAEEKDKKISFSPRLRECSVLTREFCKGLFTIAYIPLFPALLLPEEEADSQGVELLHFIKELSDALKSFLPKNTLCIRFDPDVGFSTPEERDAYREGLKSICFADKLKIKKNKVDIQPPDTTRVCLTPGEDDILLAMKSKWRYNIRLAEKKGVCIEKITGKSLGLSEKLDEFYDLFKITSERDGIAIHTKQYLLDLITKSADDAEAKKDVPLVSLYLARHEGDVLGGIITLFSKAEGVYLYGASSNVKRNLMPNFLLQWTAIKDAKLYGSLCYDMYGMPPTDDEGHPMHGLYLFKTGFGGKNLHRVGTYDVPLKSLYVFFAAMESIRAFWHKKVLKKVRGR